MQHPGKGNRLKSKGVVFYVIGLVMTVVATVVITRVFRRALNETVSEHRVETEAGGENMEARIESGRTVGVQ